MNSVGYFEIQSSNPEREIKFYETVFGWKFIKENFVPIEYYRVETNAISGGLLERPAQTPPSDCGTNAFVCSIMIENFDVTSELIIRSGGKIALPKFAIPGRCWQGYFIDQDNNTFGIFEVDKDAK
jgi:predicted enzyme related to lactoylglutathione lyase